MSVATHSFQAEVQQLLHLVIHSLYSQREIFLRELISNAADACDKLRFEALTRPELLAGDDQLGIDVTFDAEAGELRITDNGIGMSEAEAVEHLGTIARSGTKAFVERLKAAGKGGDAAGLIGQFGVGFYASFMIADEVVVESRAAGLSSDAGVRWASRGDGSYTTESISRPRRGTTIILKLKDDAKEYASHWKLRELIKRYSDFVSWPIRLPKWQSDEDAKAGKDAGIEQVNDAKPLWLRAKDEINDEQYAEFYRSTCRLYDTPATRLHLQVEGQLEFAALLFVPGERPHDLLDRDRKGLSLYVRRVFITDSCTELLPDWLRFLRGVVDSSDLPLNVSREILQEQAVLKKLRGILTKRILDHLDRLARSEDAAERSQFEQLYRHFGSILREGLADFEHRERLLKIARWASTRTLDEQQSAEPRPEQPAQITLADYCGRLAEGQDAIYYLVARNHAEALASPHLEGLRRRGIEVLVFTDPVDEWLVSSGGLRDHDGKKLLNAAQGDASPDASAQAELDAAKAALAGLMEFAQRRLDGVKEVRLTAGLTDSPCRLVSGDDAMSANMEEMMRRLGREVPPRQRILELNPKHPLVDSLNRIHTNEPERAAEYLQLLRDQAILAEGGRLDDGAGFAKRLQRIMAAAVS
jgi:molecular chaperone HtpG